MKYTQISLELTVVPPPVCLSLLPLGWHTLPLSFDSFTL